MPVEVFDVAEQMIDIFIQKLDASGNFLWAKQMGGEGWDQCYDIALDKSNNVYTTGAFAQTVDFDPSQDTFNLIAADQDDTSPQSFDVIAYIQKMMMLYEFEFSQSDIVYNYSGEKALNIKSVPSYIALILLNIVNNSLKHGFNNNGNGKIALKVEKGLKGGARITYSDDGKGMNKSTLDKVFEPFFTTRSDRGYVGGGMSTTYDVIKNKLNGDALMFFFGNLFKEFNCSL